MKQLFRRNLTHSTVRRRERYGDRIGTLPADVQTKGHLSVHLRSRRQNALENALPAFAVVISALPERHQEWLAIRIKKHRPDGSRTPGPWDIWIRVSHPAAGNSRGADDLDLLNGNTEGFQGDGITQCFLRSVRGQVQQDRILPWLRAEAYMKVERKVQLLPGFVKQRGYKQIMNQPVAAQKRPGSDDRVEKDRHRA